MNNQAVRKPVKSKIDELQPNYVYFRVSRKPFTHREEYQISDDDEFDDSDSDIEPPPSKKRKSDLSTAAGTSSSTATNIIIID
jgi:hypothetical protein